MHNRNVARDGGRVTVAAAAVFKAFDAASDRRDRLLHRRKRVSGLVAQVLHAALEFGHDVGKAAFISTAGFFETVFE